MTTLEAQDRILERLEKKFEKPALNGGFDKLVEKVEKIEWVTQKLSESQDGICKQVKEIHTVVLDPETGLYHKVKENSKWIDSTSRGLKWLIGLIIAGLLTGTGKLLYDFVTGHISFIP